MAALLAPSPPEKITESAHQIISQAILEHAINLYIRCPHGNYGANPAICGIQMNQASFNEVIATRNDSNCPLVFREKYAPETPRLGIINRAGGLFNKMYYANGNSTDICLITDEKDPSQIALALSFTLKGVDGKMLLVVALNDAIQAEKIYELIVKNPAHLEDLLQVVHPEFLGSATLLQPESFIGSVINLNL